MKDVNKWFYCLGQRDGIAQLATLIRSKNSIRQAVAEYLQPYINWDTVNWSKAQENQKLSDNTLYEMGIVDIINHLRVVDFQDIEMVCFYLCEQYNIHYEDKGKDVTKNPHVQWVLLNKGELYERNK